jgi:hypothetical protein
MKCIVVMLLVILLLSVALSYTVIYCGWKNRVDGEFFFGVSFGQETVEEAKLLIDKVKDYTNLFWVGSWNITTNETALNEVCDYAADAGLNFLRKKDGVTRSSVFTFLMSLAGNRLTLADGMKIWCRFSKTCRITARQQTSLSAAYRRLIAQ